MKTFALEIVTPDSATSPMDVVSLDVPAAEGRLTVLAEHAPLVCSVVEGETRLQTAAGKKETWHTGSGTLSVARNAATLLLRSATTAT